MNNENGLTPSQLAERNATLVTEIEKCRELSGCPAGVDLQDWVKQLAAENVALKAIVDSVTDLSNEPQYHYEGMGCGLEDRGITDRYEAMQYGWDEAMERVYGEVIPCAEEFNFSATDRIVAGIKADGRAEGINFAASRLAAAFNHGHVDKPMAEVGDVVRMILTAKEDLANDPELPEDGLSGEYAEKSLAEWEAELREGADK